MQNFIIKNLVTENIEAELEKIGFDISYRKKACDKFQYRTFKIFDLTIPQANILKQTALTVGADCGVHREVLTNKIDKTNAILGGSISQIKKICEKLKQQPFSLRILSENVLEQISSPERKTKIVGILNITPDSFSDGGNFLNAEDAIKHLNQLIEDGADMIDIGAESTKPFAKAVDSKLQIERLKPILKNIPNIPISIDTRSSEVALFALDMGIKTINDVSGLSYDKKMTEIIAKYDAEIVIQHSTNKTEDTPYYTDVVEEVYLDLLNKIETAKEKGIEKIIIDPGIGFGKNKKDNFEILTRIEEFHSLKYPIMLGISRKSLLGLSQSENNDLKDSLSAAISYPLLHKIDYLRVHNVKLHKQLLNLAV